MSNRATLPAPYDTRLDPPGGDGGMPIPAGAKVRDCGDVEHPLVADLDLRTTEQILADAAAARAEWDRAVEEARAAAAWQPEPSTWDGSDWLTAPECCGPRVTVEVVTS